jgi:hypothetical protein
MQRLWVVRARDVAGTSRASLKSTLQWTVRPPGLPEEPVVERGSSTRTTLDEVLEKPGSIITGTLDELDRRFKARVLGETLPAPHKLRAIDHSLSVCCRFVLRDLKEIRDFLAGKPKVAVY